MKENKINKTSLIKITICPETKADFMTKMDKSGIQEYCSFMTWCLDKWIISETKGLDSVLPSVRKLIALMPVQVVQRGLKFGDLIIFYKYDREKSYQWFNSVQNVCCKSRYKIPVNVMRCLIYAVILAPFDLMFALKKMWAMESVGKIRFTYKQFQSPIKTSIYDEIKDTYKKLPSAALRDIVDVLLDGENVLRDTLLQNINYEPMAHTDKCHGKWIHLTIGNDLHRLRVFEFMASHGINSRAKLIHILIDLALRLPSLINPEVLESRFDPQTPDIDYYEQDRYDRMANLYYKHTGL